MLTWDEILTIAVDFLTSWGIRLLEAVVILVVGLKLIKWIIKWLKTSPKLDKVDGSLRSFLVSFSKIALYAVLIITITSVLGVPATSFLTILASCGVAIGLALQGSLSNFAGGLLILLFKPFEVGDYIEVSGESGTVEAITVVYTVLVTPDNKRITVPNGTLTNSVIENYSAMDTRRMDLTFSVAYESDRELVLTLLQRVANAHPLGLKDPEPFVRLTELGDNGLTYAVRIWCNKDDYWTLHFDVLEQVKKAFDENGISIPYPQLDVHLDKGDRTK